MPLKSKGNLRTFNVNKIPSQPKRRKKITLVFDENKRREFLGGFHKRKLERQKKAKEELQQKLKEEKKRIKHDARERFKKLLSSRDVPELQELLSQKEYKMEGHTVSVLEVDIADLAGKSLIGENKVVYEDVNKNEESNDEPEPEEEIPGMALKEEQCKPKKKAPEPVKKIESKKELKRELKKAALKQVKKSKAFQQKQRLEHEKNKKQNKRKQMKERKSQKKEGKFKKKKNR